MGVSYEDVLTNNVSAMLSSLGDGIDSKLGIT
jgi:hypothetical protein